MRVTNVLAIVTTLVAGLLLLPSAVLAVESGSGFIKGFEDGEAHLSFRYRYEYVDQDNIDKNANASTVRTRLSYRTADFEDFSLLVELDDLRPIIADSFNDTRNGKRQYPVVADPKGTELNQMAISYKGIRDTEIIAGRQRIIRGNHRFIGNVGWRQNEQTYDAVSASFKPNEQLKVFYSYVNQVKRIFGPDSGTPTENFDSNSHLLDASYTFGPHATITGYGYLLDFDNAPTSSNDTYGVRLAGKLAVNSKTKISYVAEFATQSEAGDNPISYDADYLRLEAGTNWAGFGFNLGYEVLEGGGAPGQAFQTPLATLHGQNGWADQFLRTPVGGLEDFFISVSAELLKGKMKLIYHDYSAETGGTDYGDELDFVANWVLSKNYSVLAKFALYSADEFRVDTDKVWMMFSAKF